MNSTVARHYSVVRPYTDIDQGRTHDRALMFYFYPWEEYKQIQVVDIGRLCSELDLDDVFDIGRKGSLDYETTHTEYDNIDFVNNESLHRFVVAEYDNTPEGLEELLQDYFDKRLVYGVKDYYTSDTQTTALRRYYYDVKQILSAYFFD